MLPRRKSTHRHLTIGQSLYEPEKRVVDVISLFMPLILCFTVVASVGIGVVAAYAAVIGILEVCGRPSQPKPAEARPQLVLVPTQNHASGD
jgi:hypothetical protein